MTAFSVSLELLNLAESVYTAMQRSYAFSPESEPNHFKFPLTFPRSAAKVFAVVSNGRIKEIEIQHETGDIETIPSPKY